jgi:signal transduction histidine kinase
MRLRIIHKMFLGYSLYLAIAVFFGLFVYNQVGRIMDKQQLVEIADDMKEELLEIRRNEKNYIIRRDAVYLENIHRIISHLKEQLSSFKPDLVKALNEKDYIVLLDSVTAYSALMEEFSDNHRATLSLTGEMRKIGREIEKDILATQQYSLIQEVLEIRLLEKNYILFMEGGYLENLKSKVEALRNRIASQATVCTLCNAYLDTAASLFEHNGKETEILASIREQANRLETVINTVTDRERENIARYVTSSQRLLAVALIFLAVFGSLLSWMLSKATLYPLQKLETAVRKITEGDFDLRLDTRGDVETVSLQKSFNTMLDTLDLARESLEKTVQLLQEKGIQLIESEKLASIGILASGVAHEINNPLANISLTAETMLAAGGDLGEQERTELITDIVTQTERASAVVNNLLGYARSMKNSKTAEVDICDIVRQSIALVAHEIRLHDIDLRQDLHHCPLLVKGNRGRLEQVLVNIILNGVQAIGHYGAILLSTSRDDSGESAIIEIKDTGPGISEEHLKRVFDPFFTTKSTGEGTGLGLYVSHGIIQEHGGEIRIESEPQQGTLFRILLPLAKPATYEDN